MNVSLNSQIVSPPQKGHTDPAKCQSCLTQQSVES